MANGADPVIIDNGGSGRVGQKAQRLDGLKGTSHSDFAKGTFTGGSIDYKPNGAPVTIPGSSKKVKVSYSVGRRRQCPPMHRGLYRASRSAPSPSSAPRPPA